jgi:hypothetical protein
MSIEYPASVTPEKIYQVYIEWDLDDTDKFLEVTDAINKFKHNHSFVRHTDQGCGPCWNAYIRIFGSKEKHVKQFAEKVLRLLKRRGCTLYALVTAAGVEQ